MEKIDNISVLLIGTGAVGSFYAGRLSSSGVSVSVVARSDYDVVKEKGIRILSLGEEYVFIPENVFRKPSDCDFKPDYLIVATKVLPEIDVPALIGSCVGMNTSIILLQNGIDVERSVVCSFFDNEVISALAFVCVSRLEYGVVEHSGFGRLMLGTYPSGVSDKVQKICDIFNNSGIICEVSDDIIAERWKKLLWNAPFNPISVIAGGVNTRTMLESDLLRELVICVMSEIVMISKADSHPLENGVIEQMIESTLKMEPYKTSMLLDFENKRPMEVDAILGNTVKIAEKYLLEVPYLKSLYALLSMLNQKNYDNC